MAELDPPSYDPNGVGVDNGNFLGLPRVDRPRIRFIAAPYAATVSYGAGTEGGPANVLAASRQLDVCVPGLREPWTLGFEWDDRLADDLLALHARARPAAQARQTRLERGAEGDDAEAEGSQTQLVDHAGVTVRDLVRGAVAASLTREEFPVVVGGEHSVSLGAWIAAANGADGPLGLLQIDAHMDLRRAYEGFTHSHASVVRNAVATLPEVSVVQVGIRDYCPEEEAFAKRHAGRITTYRDDDLHTSLLEGGTFAAWADRVVSGLPERVWVSLDVDGLDPSLCSHTGTPVAGGLTFAQARYLLRRVAESDRRVIGMDVVETAGAPHEYEGAVAARLAYAFSTRVASRRV